MLLKLRLLVRTRSIKHYFYSTSASEMSHKAKTGVSLQSVVCVLEDFAPQKFSESWDNTGLLLEPYTPCDIKKILLTNDLTEEVALEAVNENCEMIISYHPPIFVPLKSIVQSNWKERVVSLLLENRIALYSPHTSWDCVRGGVNDWLASSFKYIKSDPVKCGLDPNTGAGRFLELQEAISLSDAVTTVKSLTGLSHLRLATGKDKNLDTPIKTVALCAGSGGSVLKDVVADLYLTGEMLHHDVLHATQNGISVILTNHSDSERGFLKQFSSHLGTKLNHEALIIISKLDKDPLTTV